MAESYLPEYLTADEACAYLAQRTGSPWTLPRLLDACPVPWVWLDHSPGAPREIFGDRTEGFAAPLLFAGDVQRLRAQPADGLLTMTRNPDGELFRVDPGIRFPLGELRFRRDDVLRAAGAVAAPTAGDTPSDWRAVARAHADELDAKNRRANFHDSIENIADRVAQIMRERGEHGPRGPLRGATIIREALSGAHWKRKKR